MRVVIARYHHHRHRGARNLAHRELQRFFADPARIEQVADNQHEVDLSRLAMVMTSLKFCRIERIILSGRFAQAEAVAFEMDIRRMQLSAAVFLVSLTRSILTVSVRYGDAI